MQRVCICYLISTLLLTCFVYSLISSNLQNGRALNRLREEVDDLSHVILHLSPGAQPQVTDMKKLHEMVEEVVKKRLASIMDDLYMMKKQLKAKECATAISSKKGDAVGAPIDERINYASEGLGARIEDVVAEPMGGTNFFKWLLGLDFSCNAPINMLQSNMDPGSCFAFRNQSDVTIRLGQEIFVDTIELEHIPKGRLPTKDTTSAPKAFEVYGMAGAHKCDGDKLIGKFVYENSGNCIQKFSVKSKTKMLYIRLRFLSNHGNPNCTCVYRVAVYGRPN